MAQQDSFIGTWRIAYWYPSNKNVGEEEVSEYKAVLHQDGNKLILQSKPNENQDYMIVHLVVDNDLATGYWQENTSPTGEFEGAIYSGAVQLLVDDDKKRMEGKWVGVGQEDGKKQIYTGKWEITRLG
jgi:hypothetical protein